MKLNKDVLPGMCLALALGCVTLSSAVAQTAPQRPSLGPSANALLIPQAGALPSSVPPAPAKGPYRATLACSEGVRNFPFLKPWVAKLENFIAPVQIGSTEGSLFYAMGATTVVKGALASWKSDSIRLPVDWKNKGGKIESSWLGQPGPELKGGNWNRFWSQLLAPEELKLLDGCNLRNCKIKLSDPELEKIVGATDQYRQAHFRKAIESRIQRFQKEGHVLAYEGSHEPHQWVDLPINPDFPARFDTHFWIPSARDQFGYEVLDAEPGSHKPVVALFSRHCEARGEGVKAYTACSDIVIYNNHYFDFWARLVFFFPWCDVQVALAYETLDIDQIKESRVVRILFGAEFRKLMEKLLESRLKRLHMLGF